MRVRQSLNLGMGQIIPPGAQLTLAEKPFTVWRTFTETIPTLLL
jgi:hypothetical protein